MLHTELLVIDDSTTTTQFTDHLRWNQAYYRLAQGLPGVLLFPVSKLFEYTADQKLSKPIWRPKIVPRL